MLHSRFFMPKPKPSFYYIMSFLSFLIENKISAKFLKVAFQATKAPIRRSVMCTSNEGNRRNFPSKNGGHENMAAFIIILLQIQELFLPEHELYSVQIFLSYNQNLYHLCIRNLYLLLLSIPFHLSKKVIAV